MLNALEEDPDEQHRWRRFGVGGAVALGVTTLLVYSANQYAPTRELMQRVVQIAIHVPPPEVEEKPLPPLPPPPPPKQQPKKQEKDLKPKNEPAPKPDANPQQADPSQVGMDSQSFAEGGGGPGFRVGGNQMGDPNVLVPAAAPIKPAPPAAPRKARRIEYLMAKPLKKGANTDALFNARARKLGLSGLMVMELDLDPRGRVRGIKMRKGLEPRFDKEVLEAVKSWEFEPPGSLGPDQMIASARMLRLRFTLAN